MKKETDQHKSRRPAHIHKPGNDKKFNAHWQDLKCQAFARDGTERVLQKYFYCELNGPKGGGQCN